MSTRLIEIDRYIDHAEAFAQPILVHWRALIHGCSDQVEEKIKWGMPFFDYKGPWVSFAAFKKHCSFNFWKASLLTSFEDILTTEERASMGHLGKVEQISDLPSDQRMKEALLEAMKLNEEGVKLPKRAINKTIISVDEYPKILTQAFKRAPEVELLFGKMTSSQQREYIQFINEAKTEATKEKRLAKLIEQVNEGKTLNWKYSKK